jgi:hypothetical protein
MLAVLEAVRDGIDLETHAPLPVEPLDLDVALARVQRLTG